MMRLFLFCLVAAIVGLMGAFGAVVLDVGPFEDMAAAAAGLLGFCAAVVSFVAGALFQNWMHARRT